jgi:hypothetical protein
LRGSTAIVNSLAFHPDAHPKRIERGTSRLHVKYLYGHKYNIYSCGCSGIGFIPHKVVDAVKLVEKHREKSDGELLLQKLQGNK